MHGETGAVWVPRAGLPARSAADCLTAVLDDGLSVLPDDVDRLAGEGLLGRIGEGADHPLYEEAACREPEPELVSPLRTVVRERMAWTANSCTAQEAAKLCELTVSEFAAAARDAGLRPGRLERWERAAVRPSPPGRHRRFEPPVCWAPSRVPVDSVSVAGSWTTWWKPGCSSRPGATPRTPCSSPSRPWTGLPHSHWTGTAP